MFLLLGDPAEIRTPDPLLKRQLLCRLSYRIVLSIFSVAAESVWLGRLDSNQRMRESKSLALPLGDAPMENDEGIGETPIPCVLCGVGDGTRTHGIRNHNPALCQLSYTHHICVFHTGYCADLLRPRRELVRQRGLEPLAYCLEGSCSIQLSYWRELIGAGDENRTRIPSLEGWCPDHCATPAKPSVRKSSALR